MILGLLGDLCAAAAPLLFPQAPSGETGDLGDAELVEPGDPEFAVPTLILLRLSSLCVTLSDELEVIEEVDGERQRRRKLHLPLWKEDNIKVRGL